MPEPLPATIGRSRPPVAATSKGRHVRCRPDRRRAPSILVLVGLVLGGAGSSPAQVPSTVDRMLVMPFETDGEDATSVWLGEAASLLLGDELNRLGHAALTRDERVGAFELLGIATSAALSRASVVRVGQAVGASDVVVGRIGFRDGELEVAARRLELGPGRLHDEVVERGPIHELFAIFARVAASLVDGRPAAPPRTEDLSSRPPLEAFESYVKGLVAESLDARLRFLQAAVERHERYDLARLALWEAHTDAGDHADALAVAEAVPAESPLSARARFAAALSRLDLGEWDVAFDGLRALAATHPTAPIFNNLGVLQLLRGELADGGRATWYFNQALEREPNDRDYCFNLGYAYWLERDVPAAIYWLREAVRRDPQDAEAHHVLGAALQAAGQPAEAERERELARQLSSRFSDGGAVGGSTAVPPGWQRQSLSLDTPRARSLDAAVVAGTRRDHVELAGFHLEQGRDLLAAGHDQEAIAELRKAVFLSPYEPEAHLLLGRAYRRLGRVDSATDAVRISIWSRETAAARAALAEALLEEGDAEGARREAARALDLDPLDPDAQAVLDRLGTPPPR